MEIRLSDGLLRVASHPLLKQRRQILAREAALGLRGLLRRALCDDLAALDAALRPQVDHPVGGLDDVGVMVDHHHGIALFDERFDDFVNMRVLSASIHG